MPAAKEEISQEIADRNFEMQDVTESLANAVNALESCKRRMGIHDLSNDSAKRRLVQESVVFLQHAHALMQDVGGELTSTAISQSTQVSLGEIAVEVDVKPKIPETAEAGTQSTASGSRDAAPSLDPAATSQPHLPQANDFKNEKQYDDWNQEKSGKNLVHHACYESANRIFNCASKLGR